MVEGSVDYSDIKVSNGLLAEVAKGPKHLRLVLQQMLLGPAVHYRVPACRNMVQLRKT